MTTFPYNMIGLLSVYLLGWVSPVRDMFLFFAGKL